MLKNKGFTLIELLGVIVILGIIITLATISVLKVTNQSKDKMDTFNQEQLLDAAKTYALDNPELCNSTCIFEGDEIISNLATYYPEIENKCKITNLSKIVINNSEDDINVEINNIDCKE